LKMFKLSAARSSLAAVPRFSSETIRGPCILSGKKVSQHMCCSRVIGKLFLSWVCSWWSLSEGTVVSLRGVCWSFVAARSNAQLQYCEWYRRRVILLQNRATHEYFYPDGNFKVKKFLVPLLPEIIMRSNLTLPHRNMSRQIRERVLVSRVVVAKVRPRRRVARLRHTCGFDEIILACLEHSCSQSVHVGPFLKSVQAHTMTIYTEA
jgi:hypothetical protein